jgi:hypothetical protein
VVTVWYFDEESAVRRKGRNRRFEQGLRVDNLVEALSPEDQVELLNQLLAKSSPTEGRTDDLRREIGDPRKGAVVDRSGLDSHNGRGPGAQRFDTQTPVTGADDEDVPVLKRPIDAEAFHILGRIKPTR